MAKVSGLPLALASMRHRLELLRRLDALVEERLVQGDRLPVPVQVHRDDHGLHGRALQSHGRRVGNAEEDVRRLVLPEGEPVANDRPRGFLRDGGLDAVLLEEPELVRHHDGRAIGEGDDAEAHLGRLGAVGGIGAACPPHGQAGQEGTGGRGFQELSPGRLHEIPFPKKLAPFPLGRRRRRRSHEPAAMQVTGIREQRVCHGGRGRQRDVSSRRIRGAPSMPTSWAAHESRADGAV